MSKQRLSSIKSEPVYPKELEGKLKSFFFKGVALGGGKTNKTALANIEYFPDKNKIFLHSIRSKIKTQKEYSADQQLFEYLNLFKSKTKTIAINCPLSLPKCLTCELKCPGYEECVESEIKWMWDAYRKDNRKTKKLFTPYTERCTEVFVRSELEEKFDLSHALGANMAPMTARAYYLRRRLSIPFIEVYPKLSLWRIGRSIGIQKSYLRFHKHSISGEEVREAIIKHLTEAKVAFIYQEDIKHLVRDNSVFEAFICALTGVLKYKKQVVSPPKGFPKKEAWICFPEEKINWMANRP